MRNKKGTTYEVGGKPRGSKKPRGKAVREYEGHDPQCLKPVNTTEVFFDFGIQEVIIGLGVSEESVERWGREPGKSGLNRRPGTGDSLSNTHLEV